MREVSVIKMDLPKEERVTFLEEDYGSLAKDFLKESVLKIAKRLGPLETKLTLQAIDEGRMKDFIRQVLVYYDKTYQKGINTRVPESVAPHHNAKAIIDFAKQL